MKKSLKIGLIILGIILIVFMPFMGGYNNIVSLQENVSNLEGNIQTNLQRRNDLIPNLVSTVKGYATHEKEIFTQIAEARAKLGGAKNINDTIKADSQMTSALSRLLIVAENYPNLQANQNFKDLTVALEGTENRINIARQDYNNAVSKYNKTIRTFPNSIIARFNGFDKKEYFKASESAKEAPKVDFSK